MAVFIDTNIAFIEKSDFDFEHTNKNFLHRKDFDKLKSEPQFNCLNKNGVFEVSLFIGLDTTFTKNNILNSSFYDQDINLGQDLTPYVESNSYKGNKIDVPHNPKVFRKTYGVDNPSESFDKFMSMPFEDIDGTNSTSDYFTNAETINFIRYFSDYASDKLNGSLDVFGTVDSITNKNLTLYEMKGIKGDIISGGTDARNRQVNISNRVRVDGQSTSNNIEPFLDQLDDTNITNEADQIVVDYEYTVQSINNRNYIVFRNDADSSSVITVNTSSQYFLSEDEHNIIPFDDTRVDDFIILSNLIQQDSDYNRTDNYASAGSNNNNANGGLPESIAFLGEIN